ncbi:reverse transcriptase domain-containing protein [Tanacetum coccineum]|uniref:Reverse transcriptase domain-containing protein n=1 Tax=Tanacetum coccineum TaxID=301880 RepID=A0ABQ4XQT1_9ASTR
MADQRTMAELLCAPTEGYAEEIVVPPILAEHFELKHSIINLITSTLRYKDVPETSFKLVLFPFSIDGPARIWIDKEPPRSILTWDDLVSKFINHFFPPSKMTNLHNEISNFNQKFEEMFNEAWDHFKDLLRACPHHGFTELHQLDTFYNGLNPFDQDSLNSAVDPSKMAALTDAIRDMMKDYTNMLREIKNQYQRPDPVKAITKTCCICGGAHPYQECLATDGNTYNISAAITMLNHGSQGYRSNQMAPPAFPPVQNNQNRYNQNNQAQG